MHTFIDENCVSFDNEEENKLEHTEIHKRFCKIVEDLLDNLTAEFEIPHEVFLKACELVDPKTNEGHVIK